MKKVRKRAMMAHARTLLAEHGIIKHATQIKIRDVVKYEDALNKACPDWQQQVKDNATKKISHKKSLRKQRRQKSQTRRPLLVVTMDRIQQFYASYDWRKLRYSILVKYGKRCMACGIVPDEIHVDHIQPVRKYWHRRLDPSNLQVLCPLCNHGKGNWDMTDWRPSSNVPNDPDIVLTVLHEMNREEVRNELS